MGKYTFGRWQGSDGHAYMQVHGPNAYVVGSINLENVFTFQNNSYGAVNVEELKKFDKKKFKSHMDCLDHLNGEVEEVKSVS